MFLRRRCSAGEWEPGERLPAVAELAQHYGVARNTVIKALRRLAEDGPVGIVPNWEPSGRGNRSAGRDTSGATDRRIGARQHRSRYWRGYK